jgi:hypothetical protein
MSAIDLGSTDIKVSVAMITYNHEQFIAQAIESVLMQQTDFTVELVIGEDCSTDGTRSIVQDYASKHPGKIKPLLHPQNLGPVDSPGKKNFVSVFSACRGKYVAILEGDDYWTDPLKLQKQVDFLEAHPECSICFHRFIARFEDGSNRPPHVSMVPHGGSIFSLEDLLVQNFIGTATVMYRQGVVPELPDWYFTLSTGDRSLHTLHAEHGMIGFIDEIMAVYRVHAGGVWSVSSSAHRLAVQMAFYTTMRQHLGLKYAARIDAGMSKAYFREAVICENKGNPTQARGYLLRSIKEYPLNPYIRLIDLASMQLRLFAPTLHRILKPVQVRLFPMWSRNRQILSKMSTEQSSLERSDPTN